MRITISVIVCVMVAGISCLDDFECETLEPNAVMDLADNLHFGITILNEDGQPTHTFNDQSGLRVKIRSPGPIAGFIMQCRVPSSDTAIGKFVALDRYQKTASCGSENDTLVNSSQVGEDEIITRWVPLGRQVKRVNEIEFTITIKSNSYTYHSNIHSIIVDREGTKKSPQDENKSKQEYIEKIIKLGEDEQRTGEEEIGKEIKEREDEAKRQEKERLDAELQAKIEYDQNQERIRAELEGIRDNEMKNIFDDVSSSNAITTCFLLIVSCIIASLIM